MRCNCPIDDRTCRIDRKLFHLTNRTNRSNRQHFVHFSLMKCNFPIDAIDDRACRIDRKLFHLTNRTNRSNRQHFVHFSLIKWNFSDRQQIERCFVGWTLCDSIGHECQLHDIYIYFFLHFLIHFFGRFSLILFSEVFLHIHHAALPVVSVRV